MTGSIPNNKLTSTFWNQMMRPEKSLIKDNVVKKLAARIIGGLAYLVGNIFSLGFMWRVTHRTGGPTTPSEKKTHLIAAKKAIATTLTTSTTPMTIDQAKDVIIHLNDQKADFITQRKSRKISKKKTLQEVGKLSKQRNAIIKSLPKDDRIKVIKWAAHNKMISPVSTAQLFWEAGVENPAQDNRVALQGFDLDFVIIQNHIDKHSSEWKKDP
jgi:hypothetical protein